MVNMLLLRRSLPIIYIVLLVEKVSCANILIIMHFLSKSLHMGGVAMSDILVEKGHNVTLVTSYKVDGSKKFEHVHLSDTIQIFNSTETDPYLFNFQINPYLVPYLFNSMGLDLCNKTFQNENFKRLLASKRNFDLVIVESVYADSLFYVSEIFNAPLLLYSSVYPSFWSNPPVGNPAPPSYIPDIMSHYASEMTFFERLDNSIRFLINELVLYGLALPGHDAIVKENFPGAPDIENYYHKASMLLLNSDPSVADPIPKVPGMIEIGGFHIRPPKPLPKDLQKIIDEAEEGIIYFSMGSNLQSSQMPRETVQAILNVFGKLKQTILWKWEDEELSGKPDNVIIRKWMPQNDILAQKNVKLFITHGGFHGMLETVFYGVPCVSLPVFVDQLTNSRRGEKMGFIEWMPFPEFTETKFEEAVRKVLQDPRYKKAVVKRSKIMRDAPLSKAELLTFWVEYAIRNRGADYLKVASLKLSWYQYLLLDVIAFIILCITVVSALIGFVLKKLYNVCRSPKIKVKTT